MNCKRENAFVKWREGANGAGKMEKEHQKDVETEHCRVCQVVQHQVQLWTKEFEIKCFHKESEQWGRDRKTVGSFKTLMAIAWARIQITNKIWYRE